MSESNIVHYDAPYMVQKRWEEENGQLRERFLVFHSGLSTAPPEWLARTKTLAAAKEVIGHLLAIKLLEK